MNKPTNKYWQKRFELLTESLLNKGERYTKDLTTEYEKAIISIQSDIQKFYSRFAQNNSMTLAESKKLLNSKELQEFHWTVEEYIQKGKENAINQLWMKELENASTRVRVKRLEALQYQIRQQIEMITARRLDGMNRLSDELIKDGYYKSIYEIQKGFGIGNTFSILDTKIIENIISKPWAPDGSNFSSRIWRDRDVLVSKLQTELAQTFIRGDAPDTAIRNISKTMDVSRRSAGRLVMTESAYFSAAGQKKAYHELEIEEYEIVATLDTITSDLCQSLDGNVLPMSEYSPGTTAPPFHPYCRTVTVPYFSDNDTERFARGIDGKGYKVPGDMKYKEWYNEYVVNAETNDIIKLPDVVIGKSLGAAVFKDSIKLPNGKTAKLTEGSKITKVVVFAGKGTNKPIKVASHLSKQYGIPESEWKKVRGDGYIDENGLSKHVELHWFESNETGRIKMKVKRYFNDES